MELPVLGAGLAVTSIFPGILIYPPLLTVFENVIELDVPGIVLKVRVIELVGGALIVALIRLLLPFGVFPLNGTPMLLKSSTSMLAMPGIALLSSMPVML